MGERSLNEGGPLRAGIATVLRIGTLAAIAIVAAGYLVSLVTGAPRDARPLIDQLGAGGGPAIVAAGLLALTLVPVGVVVLAGIGFARSGERRLAITAAIVLVLLVASLLAAAVIATVG